MENLENERTNVKKQERKTESSPQIGYLFFPFTYLTTLPININGVMRAQNFIL